MIFSPEDIRIIKKALKGQGKQVLSSFHKKYCMIVFLVKLSFTAEIIEKY